MDQQKQLEQLVLVCLDTARGMLDEYKLVIPFGIRAFSDSEDMKMNCPAKNDSDEDWNTQIDAVVNELKHFVSNENVFATALVTELESDGESGIGLQIETLDSSVLFVYPFKKETDEWVIDEPVQTDQLLSSVFENNAA